MPEAYGGAGVHFSYSAIAVEEMARAGATGPLFYLHSDIVAPYLVHYGTEAQKRHWLPRMASGEVIAAIGMTEPGAGSDLAAIRTRAEPRAGGWRINGQKIFISNGQIADLLLLAAKTDPSRGAKGVSLLLVDTTLKGFGRGKRLDKLGMHAQDTSELFFTDLDVDADTLLGEEGAGFKAMMNELTPPPPAWPSSGAPRCNSRCWTSACSCLAAMATCASTPSLAPGSMRACSGSTAVPRKS